MIDVKQHRKMMNEATKAKRRGDMVEMGRLNALIDANQAICEHQVKKATVGTQGKYAQKPITWCAICNKLLTVNGKPTKP
jgi:hypothetical protein